MTEIYNPHEVTEEELKEMQTATRPMFQSEGLEPLTMSELNLAMDRALGVNTEPNTILNSVLFDRIEEVKNERASRD